MNKAKLYVQVITNVGLSKSRRRRRSLLQTGGAVQTRSYLTDGINVEQVTVISSTPQGTAGQEPTSGDSESNTNTVVIVIVVIIVLLLCIFIYWYMKRRNDKNKGRVSWEPETEMQSGGRGDSLSAGDGNKGNYTVPMTGTAGGGAYDETPINPDGEFVDEDPEIDALDDDDKPNKKKYSKIKTSKETSSPDTSPVGDGDLNETDILNDE